MTVALLAEIFCFGIDQLEFATPRTRMMAILFGIPAGMANSSVVQS